MRWLSPRIRRIKYFRRLSTILANSLNSLLLPAFNISISFLVIRLAGPSIWGEFVGIFILIQFGALLIAWGNKEYLLRAFSRSPAKIQGLWLQSLLTRGLIYLVLSVIATLWFRLTWKTTGLLAWGFGVMLAQSAEVLVLYKKDFYISILVELSSLTAICLGILGYKSSLSPDVLLGIFAVVSLGKGGFYLLFYHPYTIGNLRESLPDREFLVQAFPFFLLTLSGLLNSRMDLYVVNLYSSDQEVAQYQVFTNVMIYLQSTGVFILTPFVKNLYRLKYPTLVRISGQMFRLGVILLPPALMAAYQLIPWLYHFDLPPSFYLIGGLFILPTFYILPIIYALFKAEKQNVVVWLNFGGAAMVFLLNLWLLPQFGILGALVSVALVKWGLFLIYSRLAVNLKETSAMDLKQARVNV